MGHRRRGDSTPLTRLGCPEFHESWTIQLPKQGPRLVSSHLSHWHCRHKRTRRSHRSPHWPSPSWDRTAARARARGDRSAMSGVERMVHLMAADGLRVIGVARRQLTHRQVQSACEDPDAFAELCRDRLRIAGLLGLSDTGRPQAADLLASLAANDVGVRLITGDHAITAAAIATA
jgi:magnesium-transporting ATPase (P-type)